MELEEDGLVKVREGTGTPSCMLTAGDANVGVGLSKHTPRRVGRAGGYYAWGCHLGRFLRRRFCVGGMVSTYAVVCL